MLFSRHIIYTNLHILGLYRQQPFCVLANSKNSAQIELNRCNRKHFHSTLLCWNGKKDPFAIREGLLLTIQETFCKLISNTFAEILYMPIIKKSAASRSFTTYANKLLGTLELLP